MTALWTRRDVLKTIAATASSPVLAHAAPPRRTVAIMGGGMAGVSVAWLLDGHHFAVDNQYGVKMEKFGDSTSAIDLTTL